MLNNFRNRLKKIEWWTVISFAFFAVSFFFISLNLPLVAIYYALIGIAALIIGWIAEARSR